MLHGKEGGGRLVATFFCGEQYTQSPPLDASRPHWVQPGRCIL